MRVMGGDSGGGPGLVLRLLGPVEIGRSGGVMAPVPQPRLRVLLALLGVAAGRVVSAEALVDGVWGEEWSPGRELNLHSQVSALRRRLARTYRLMRHACKPHRQTLIWVRVTFRSRG